MTIFIDYMTKRNLLKNFFSGLSKNLTHVYSGASSQAPVLPDASHLLGTFLTFCSGCSHPLAQHLEDFHFPKTLSLFLPSNFGVNMKTVRLSEFINSKNNLATPRPQILSCNVKLKKFCQRIYTFNPFDSSV